jgi:DNA polymerase-3 subunit beta
MTATATKTKASSTTVSLPKTELLDALLAIKPATPTRPAKPILANCRIGDGIISGTDLEVRIDRAIAEQCEPFLVPHDRLLQIVKAATGDTVKLKADATSVTVKCGSGSWTLPTEDVAEYPMWEPEDAVPLPILPVDQFARAVRSVAYACDDQSSQYALGSVLFEVSRESEKCWLVASDGRRLSVAEMPLPDSRDVDDVSLLVPHRVMSIIERIAQSHGEDGTSVDLSASSSVLVAQFEGERVVATLANGRFPRWRDVFPKRAVAAHAVDIKSLHNTTLAAAIVTSEQSKGVNYAFSDSGLTLTAKSSESGESCVKCEVANHGNEALVKLDPRFVSHVLKALKTLDGQPHVRVEVGGPGDAVVFLYGEDDEYRSVIMPLAGDA